MRSLKDSLKILEMALEYADKSRSILASLFPELSSILSEVYLYEQHPHQTSSKLFSHLEEVSDKLVLRTGSLMKAAEFLEELNDIKSI